MEKVLIIQTAFIGDVILATSLVEEIIHQYPHSKIDFLLRKGNESLLENNPHIKNIIVWDKKKKYSSLFQNILSIRKNRYDVIINVQRFFNSGLLTVLGGARKTVGFDKNPLSRFFTHRVSHLIPDKTNGEYLHEVQRNAKLLRPLASNGDHKLFKPKLYFSNNQQQKIDALKLPEDYLVMAPSSVWFTKQWSQHKWDELIKHVSTLYPVYLIGAPSDKEFTSTLATENTVNLCGELSLLESALLMKNAKRVFVNDSAPLHLASSVNAKTTAIFCSTIPEFGYFPLADDSVIIQRDRLACMPCGLHGKKACPLTHFKCSEDITIQEVAKTIV